MGKSLAPTRSRLWEGIVVVGVCTAVWTAWCLIDHVTALAGIVLAMVGVFHTSKTIERWLDRALSRVERWIAPSNAGPPGRANSGS